MTINDNADEFSPSPNPNGYRLGQKVTILCVGLFVTLSAERGCLSRVPVVTAHSAGIRHLPSHREMCSKLLLNCKKNVVEHQNFISRP